MYIYIYVCIVICMYVTINSWNIQKTKERCHYVYISFGVEKDNKLKEEADWERKQKRKRIITHIVTKFDFSKLLSIPQFFQGIFIKSKNVSEWIIVIIDITLSSQTPVKLGQNLNCCY